MVLTPYRRLAFQHLVWMAAIAVWGVAEAVSSTFALVLLAVCVPYGWFLRRFRRGRTDYANLSEPPPGSLVEAPTRTALRAFAAVALFIPYVVIGLFYPVVGAAAGGVALGFLLVQLRTIQLTGRVEARHGWQLLRDVPPRVIARYPRPAFFHSGSPRGAA